MSATFVGSTTGTSSGSSVDASVSGISGLQDGDFLIAIAAGY